MRGKKPRISSVREVRMGETCDAYHICSSGGSGANCCVEDAGG